MAKKIVSKVSKKDEELEPTPARISQKDSSAEEAKVSKADVKVEDYLRQYQYKKLNGIPYLGSVAGAQTDPDKGSKAEVMKASLLLQPRIRTLIPLDPGTDPKVLSSVTLNGYRLDFPTNTYIDVPEQVASIIMESNSQTNAALNQFRTNRTEPGKDFVQAGL